MTEKDDASGRCACKSLCRGVEVPTDDELMALNAMRAIKKKVTSLKTKLAGFRAGGSEVDHSETKKGMEQELDRLRAEWKEWEEKRKRAAEERMVLLGHEEGGSC